MGTRGEKRRRGRERRPRESPLSIFQREGEWTGSVEEARKAGSQAGRQAAGSAGATEKKTKQREMRKGDK